MSDELATLDATAQAQLVRDGELSPLELVDAAIARIEALNPELNAVIHPLFEKARAEASGDLPDGPFKGVPLLLKDLGAYSAGDPLNEGMKFLRDLDWHEDSDMGLVTRFRKAGFVICGRTNTPELGILPTTEPEAHGASRNPWSTAHSTGGSSGGSAAAVASGMVPVAHANDGGGSIRIPASKCGLVGLKPSRGRVSLAPDFGDIMSGLVADHVVTRSVRDCAAVLDATHGMTAGDPYGVPDPSRPYAEELEAGPGPLRIGSLTSAPGGAFEVDPACVEAVEDAASLLTELGHSVDESHPEALHDPGYTEQFIARWTAGVAWNLDYWSRKTGVEVTAEGVEASTWALAEMGRAFGAPQYLSALEYQQRTARQAAAWWEDGFDLLLTPTSGERPAELGSFAPVADNPAAPIFRSISVAGFTAFWNASGQPAISLPLHWTRRGTAGRHPPRRRLRPRGPAALDRGRARARPPLGRSPSTGVRELMATATELGGLDATAQAELVRKGEAQPARAGRRRDRSNRGDRSRAQLGQPPSLRGGSRRGCRASSSDGPFRGVPFLLKDLGISFAGQPLHMGMQALKDADFRAPADSYLALRFRGAGLVTVGKTNTPEIGILPTTEPDSYGATRNPWDTSRTAGGSSGGAGAAVAAGLVPFAHASDGGGSIRIPASFNGLVGLKTTRARTTAGPLTGDFASGLSENFAVTRSVRDAAALLDAVHGPGPGRSLRGA